MASFSPSVISNLQPGIQISSTNVTYDEIKRSLGDWVYGVQRVYVQSPSAQQIRGTIDYQSYDANGSKVVKTMVPGIDPYQTQNSKFFGTQEFDVILNGQSSLGLIMLPSTSLKIELFCSKIGKKDALNNFSPDNFAQIESAMGLYRFFEDWSDKI